MRVPSVSIAFITVLFVLLTLPAGSSATAQGTIDGRSTAEFFSDWKVSSDDPYLAEQWALYHINLPKSTAITGDRQVIVAILDTGIDSGHEDLAGKVFMNVNFSNSPTSEDLHGHGTHVAGIIAAQANNSIGIAGIAPEAKLMNIKVADDNGVCRAGAITKGIYLAVENGAMVINISLELQNNSEELEKAVNYAWERGVIIIAAAGNNTSNTPVYPASSKNCIAVGAVGQNNELAPLSNYGDWVDVAAPGLDICTTAPDNLYRYVTGTSFAAAYVSGLAAILVSTMVDSNSNGRINDEVRQAIENGCHKTDTNNTGYGVIDVTRSLSITDITSLN